MIPSLDAGGEELFRYVNRPCEGIPWEGLLGGLASFRNGYRGRYWLEVFLLGGITATQAEVKKIARLARRIGPDRVQLDTVARPPAERFAKPVPRSQMERLAAHFMGPVEIIAARPPARAAGGFAARLDDVVDLLRRRPCP